MRRIVFSISFSRQNWKVQLVFTSTKSRRNFYTQVERQSFHTAWVKRRNTRSEQMWSALHPKADSSRTSRPCPKSVPNRHVLLFDHLVRASELKEHGGLDELARAREACGFANYVLFQHRLHRVLSARAALTAGLACKAPSTATEAIVARASSGETS
jgi:hypothetical protein